MSKYQTYTTQKTVVGNVVTFTFPRVQSEQIWSGAVIVLGNYGISAVPIQWRAYDDSTTVPLTTWFDDQPSGPIQIAGQLIVQATISPAVFPVNTPTVLVSPTTAFFVGDLLPASSAPPFTPVPVPAPPSHAAAVVLSTVNQQQSAAFTAIPVVPGAVTSITVTGWSPAVGSTGYQIVVGFGPDGNIANALDIQVFDVNGALPGWEIVNGGPVMWIAVNTNKPGDKLATLVVTTNIQGAPQPLSPPNGVLQSSSVTLNPGVNNFPLNPFRGDVWIEGQISSAGTGALDFQLTGTDHNGVVAWQLQIVGGQATQYGFWQLGPVRCALPGLIIVMDMHNRTGSILNGSFSITEANAHGGGQ